jgi:peptide chain release factor 3
MGRELKGVYHLYKDFVHLYKPSSNNRINEGRIVHGLDNPELDELLGGRVAELRDEIELVRGASNEFNIDDYLRGEVTPVYFGSAISNFGVQEMLNDFVDYAPVPQPHATDARMVSPQEEKFSGFVFKIQANMDPAHRDRIAFLRVCSGVYTPAMKARHVRLNRDIKIADALTFMASDRERVETAYPGDIIGLHNHGTIRIGDTLTLGEELSFTGIPDFAPELFRRARLRDPLRMKALQKGLQQLCEEGATQLFRPLDNNDLILGAIGILQFDVAAYRLKSEYGVDCLFENVNVYTARWVNCDDPRRFEEFKKKTLVNLALDHHDELVYIAPSRVNLQLTQERWPEIRFSATREHGIH